MVDPATYTGNAAASALKPVRPSSQFSFRRPRYMSEAEYAQKILNEHRAAKIHDQKNLERSTLNNRLYWAVDTDKGMGQIAPGIAAEMIRIGKPTGAYNICRPVVDNVVGDMLQRNLGFDFRPVSGDMTSLTYMARDVIFAESELMDWSETDMYGAIDACIYRADYEFFIDRTQKDPYLNWRLIPPGEITWPPKLSHKHRDRTKVHRRRMMSPMDMLEYFGSSRMKIIQSVMYKQFGERAIEELAKLQMEQGDEYGTNYGVIPMAGNEQMWGTEYEVVFCYHMEKVTRSFEYVLTEDMEKVEIPKDLTDPQAKIEWLNMNAPGWVPDAVFADEEELNIQYVTAVCESLNSNMLICDGPTEMQCGMLSIVPRSAYFKNGEFGGLIDSIKDIQISLNWIQNTLQYRLHIDGEGTSWYVYPEAFITPEEYQRWIDCKNKAGEHFAMKPGMEQRFPNGPAVPVQKSSYPKEATDRLEQLLDKLLPLISKYTPASRGQVENSSESGYLFNLKKLQNDVERKVLMEMMRNFKNLQGEMWLGAAVSVHGNKIAKKFFNSRTGGSFEINKRMVETLPSGEVIEYIANDLSRLKDIRHRVIIVDSPDSPTRRAENMQVAGELLGKIQNPNAVPISYTSLSHSLLRGAENLSEDEKREQEEGFALEMELAIETTKAQIAAQKAAAVQALASIQPPAPPVPGMAGSGAGAGSVPEGVPGQGAPVAQQQTVGTLTQ